MIGYVSEMLNTDDPRSLRDQLDQGYRHGGGWNPIKGFKLNEDNSLKYPGDPKMKVMYEARFGDQLFCVYEHAWFAIINADRSFEVCRMD